MQKIFLILPFILLFSLTSCERNEEVIKSTKQSVVGIETTTGGISKAEVMKSEAIIGTGVISEYGNINQPINQPNDYLIIKEWGVEIKKTADMSDLQYVTYNPENKTNHVSFVMFTTQQLLDLDKTIGGKCTDYSIGSMIRFTVTEFNDLKNEKYGPGVPDAVKIGDYYYSFFVPPEACLANEQFTEMEVKQTSVLKDIILKNLRKVSMK